jgi:hypothetical protein
LTTLYVQQDAGSSICVALAQSLVHHETANNKLMWTDPVAFMSLNFIIWKYLLRGVAPNTLAALSIPIAIGIVDKFLFVEGYLEDPEGTENNDLLMLLFFSNLLKIA